MTGVGVISQLSNLVSLLNYFVPLGIPNGLSKFVAEESISDSEKLKNLFVSSITLVLYPTITFAILIFIFSGSVSYFLFETIEYSDYIRIISVFIPFLVSNSLLEGFLRGLKVINLYTKIIIISNILNVIIILPLVWKFGITGGLFGIVSSYVIYTLLSIYYLKKNKILEKIEFKRSFNKIFLKRIFSVSLVFLISGALFQFTLLLLRKLIIAEFGIFYNGIFQGVIGISLSYFGFIFLSLSTYSFPTISKLNTTAELIDELNINIRYIIFLMVPLIILVFVFRYFVISLLLSKDFLNSEKLFGYQFMGDYFKALAWAIGIWLIPKMKLKSFVIMEIILNLNLIIISWVLIKIFGTNLEFISISYLISYVIHFILNLAVTRKLLGFQISNANNKLLILSFVFLIPILLISHHNPFVSYFLVIPVMILWFKLSMEKKEFAELKGIIYSKLKKA